MHRNNPNMTCELCGTAEDQHTAYRNVLGGMSLLCPPFFTTRFRAQEGSVSPSTAPSELHALRGGSRSPTRGLGMDDIDESNGHLSDTGDISGSVSSTVREAPPAGYPMLKSEEATLAAEQFRDEPPPEFYPDPAAPQGAGR